jgi:hypothetical protein
MGRSRKDSRRRLTVDGVAYRYRISPDDGFISLIVRQEDGRGQCLRVSFGYHDEWVPTGGGSFTSTGHRLILPRVVRGAILEGLRRGWDPSATPPHLFRIHDGDSLLPAEEWPRTPRREVSIRLDASENASTEVETRPADRAVSTRSGGGTNSQS